MSEPRWEELVRSPLEPDTEEASSRPVSTWVVALIAAIVGFSGGAVVGLVGGSGQSEGVGLSDTATTARPEAPDPVAPTGYVPVGDTSLGVMGSFGADGHKYVIVGEAALSGAEPGATPAFGAGRWATLDGDDAIEAAVEIVDPIAPGMRLLDFPLDEWAADEPLVVWQGTAIETRDGCSGCGSQSIDRADGASLVEVSGLPTVIPGMLTVELGQGLEVQIGDLTAAAEWGYTEWALTGDTAATARVAVEVTFVGTDDPSADGDNPTRLVPYDQAPIQYGVGHPRTAPPFDRAGSIRLTRVGEPVGGDNEPTGLSVSWSVEWIRAVGEPIPLAGS